MFNSVSTNSIGECVRLLDSFSLGSMQENFLGDISSLYKIFSGSMMKSDVSSPIAGINNYPEFKHFSGIKDACMMRFSGFNAVPIHERVCGDTQPKSDPAPQFTRIFMGNIFEGNALIKEFCCESDQLGTFIGIMNFMEAQLVSIGERITKSLTNGVYAPVVIQGEGGNLTKTLQEEAKTITALGATGLTFKSIDMAFLSIKEKINPNASNNKFTILIPNSLYSFLLGEEDKKSRCCTPWEYTPYLNGMIGNHMKSTLGYKIILVSDGDIMKDSSGNWQLPVIYDGSMAMKLFRPQKSDICAGKGCFTELGNELYPRLLGDAGRNLMPEILFFVDCLAGYLNYNSKISFMYGFVAGRARDEGYGIIPVPSNPTPSADWIDSSRTIEAGVGEATVNINSNLKKKKRNNIEAQDYVEMEDSHDVIN